jgi:aminomethyltransferase
MAVRQKAGLFDVSHMGELIIRGRDALNNLQMLLTNDFKGMADGQARYSPMCCENGGIVDDLIVYRIEEEAYLIVVNASNKDKDYAWMKAHMTGEAKILDISESVAQIALQGPRSHDILCKIAGKEDIPEKYYYGKFHADIQETDCLISRTGYTGEDGYEIYLGADRAEEMWNLLLESGREEGLIPCGLGCRDTLRLEAAMPLYGHEMNENITPLEAGLSFAVKMKKDDFIGKNAILEKGEPSRKRVGLKVTGRGIIREQAEIFAGDRCIGFSTSGTHCPYLGYPAAMAMLEMPYTPPGTAVKALVRGRMIDAEVVALPFYKRAK